MRYNLGTFEPRPGSRDFRHVQASVEFGEPMTRALEEMLRVRLSHAKSAQSTDLLETLPSEHPDRSWVEAVHRRMQEVEQAGIPLRLLACEMEEGENGFLTIAATAPTVRWEVLGEDWMQVGFAAMREGEGEVRAWPRLLREVCQNGSIICVAELERHDGVTGLGEAIGRFLAPELYEPAVLALREAADTPVPDPRALFDEYARVWHWVDEPTRERLVHTLYGLMDYGVHSRYEVMNVITAAARDIEGWPERLGLEELGGQLALLRPPVPQRSRGATLVPA